jgi:glycosyltransferase involved in cell wall biosynthesis
MDGNRSADRGLVHLARMWPEVLKADPLASIRVTYNVAEYIERNRWLMDERGQQALEIERWIADNPDTVIAGVTGYEDVRLEQARSELCAYPMDPLNAGVGIHALAVQECAAAGCALLLSYHEGLPEVFGECADFLELPVNYTDWVREIADILQDGGRRIAMQDKALQWARRHPWERWEAAWRGLVATGHYAEVAA